MTPLSALPLRRRAKVLRVGGPAGFRRRLMEFGLVPGTIVEVVRVAPLGDPVELLVRGCRLSIRLAEAAEVTVFPQDAVDVLGDGPDGADGACGGCRA